ncbi:MAG: Gfo/Idh/MocA family oxidoreductase [Clostridiales bacterium]|jgi:predicted dehydrogenase|nr:Gfo/Idh/MocA family oxidoreductase [Clostridiales bacterium]
MELGDLSNRRTDGQKRIKIAILGIGNRGRRYAYQIKRHGGAEITALCDKKTALLRGACQTYGVGEDMAFDSDEKFFAAGKLADALIIATQDRDHYGHAVKALNLGYNLLLEKPVSPVPKECEEIASLAREKNLSVIVCHVLRYSPFYHAIKETVDSGMIGDIVSVNDTENIGYWHFSHSYVRGNWRNEAETGPSILAKCCHDLDIIHYFTEQKCKEVYSSGSRKLFVKEKAPENAADYCLAPCPHRKTCAYDVEKIYYGITRYTVPKMSVHIKLITGLPNPKLKDLKESLKTSPYGRCVYKCDNDVVENQNVAMLLNNGINANLTMTAFSKGCFRRLYISGTKGEIIGVDAQNKFRINVFGGPSKTVKVSGSGIFGHLGGDKMLIHDFLEYLNTGKTSKRISFIDVTLESHRIAFAAEESRKTGMTIKL